MSAGAVAVVRALLVAGPLLLPAACATTPAPPAASSADPPVAGRAAGAPRWWVVSVRMPYPDAAGVKWYLDALLADRVFGPIVDRYGPALVPWRFHRRAAPDEGGHMLRFLFHADPAVAERVTRAIDRSALLDALERAGEVSAVRVPGPGESPGDDLAAASDPAWPPSVQRSWPWFAMGASLNWLSMIREEGAALGAPTDEDLEATLSRYAAINAAVDAQWRRWGRHAWLHHLNALYGYQPLVIREERLIVF